MRRGAAAMSRRAGAEARLDICRDPAGDGYQTRLP